MTLPSPDRGRRLVRGVWRRRPKACAGAEHLQPEVHPW